MFKTKTKIECPKCGYPVNTVVPKQRFGFVLFICPDCHSNVVHYNNKTDIISSELIARLKKENKIKLMKVEELSYKGKKPPISTTDIKDLKTALKDSTSVDDFLSKIS